MFLAYILIILLQLLSNSQYTKTVVCMPGWLKLTLKIGGFILGLLFIIWIAVAAYVYSHKKELLQAVSSQLNDNLRGKLTIGRMEPSLIRGFPGISVSLEDVLLRDSLWEQHKHDLLKARNVYIAINAFSILSGSPAIQDIRIHEGSVYLFTDSTGLRNTDIFRKKSGQDRGEGGGGEKRIYRISMKKVALTVDDRLKNKLFKFNVDDFLGRIYYKGEGWEGKVKLRSGVESFAFNLEKGSFLKNKALAMDLDLLYNDDSHLLTVPKQKIRIDKNNLMVGGTFGFGDNSSDFELDVEAPSIVFREAGSLLSAHIASKLAPYDLKDPISAKASIKGKLKNGGEPLINVSWNVKDNTLHTGGLIISDCSFSGIYNNEWVKGKGRDDANSVILFRDLKGKYYDIPFNAASVQIEDLKNPVFTGKFQSAFPLGKLNQILGINTFMFSSGNADLDLTYKAPFDQDNKGERFINGYIRIRSAKANYKPRNLSLKEMNMDMDFKGRDLIIRNLRVKSATSSLSMEGSVKNFSNLYYSDPEKMLINWQVKSPKINLNEFMGFVARRKPAFTAAAGSDHSAKKISSTLEKILALASMQMDVNIGTLIYKNFQATDVRADMTLRQSGITISNMSLRQGGGSLSLKGNLDQSGTVNRFNVNSKINNVNVEKLFYAFDNFGQDAIVSRNLRGAFFGGTSISGSMNNEGGIIPGSFRGTVNFDIRNGALIDFEPMTKLGAFAFPKRDFSNIRFTSLRNTLDIRGNKVLIPPMAVRSTVLNVFLEGVYSFSTGTNIAIRIPLRNPGKDEEISDKALKRERDLKGIVINLRALDGDDGKVRFRLGKKTPQGYEE